MKKIVAALLSFAFVSVNAQTADEVIQKYATNMGGLDAFNKVSTVKFSGTLVSQGKSYPLTIQIVNGKSMRTDVEVNGQTVNSVYNNGTGWKLNPFDGTTTPTEVTGTELASLKAQASFANNLMDYKKRGHQVELLGQEDVEGVKAFKIKLTSKDDGKVTTYFISTVDYILVRSDSKQKIQANEYDAESYYSNIKEVNGLKIMMNFVRKIQGQVFQEVKYDKADLNIPIDAKIFEMPKQ